MKIYSFPFALTLESSLTIAEIELLQKKNSRALKLFEMRPDGREIEIFGIGAVKDNKGAVCAAGINYVGTTKNGKAGMSILIPASLEGKAVGDYIDEKLAEVSRMATIVEKNAAQALKDVAASKDNFLGSIIELEPETNSIPVKEEKKTGGKK